LLCLQHDYGDGTPSDKRLPKYQMSGQGSPANSKHSSTLSRDPRWNLKQVRMHAQKENYIGSETLPTSIEEKESPSPPAKKNIRRQWG